VRAELVVGLLAQAAVLAALHVTVGWSPLGALVAVVYAGAVSGLLGLALERAGSRTLGPANRITLLRAVLVGGVVALVADLERPTSGPLIAGLAAVALALDAVDGRVARRTGTVSAVGARFDVEVDSVLVLALSVEVSRSLGAWVLVLGSVHYLLMAAAAVLPWLRRPAPPRYWCKVVAAIQGIALGIVATGVVVAAVAIPVLAVVAALLAESFGREVWWLWRTREVAYGLGTPALEPAGG
jgi:phosphatidylglycerophosphate synthase